MNIPTTKQVLLLHRMLTEQTGGDANLRDADLLDSAIRSPFQTFGGEELYPTLEEKAARLGFSLISNHAFVDGNKRIGVLLMLAFLRANGRTLCFSDEDIVQIGLGVADGSIAYEGLLKLVQLHTR